MRVSPCANSFFLSRKSSPCSNNTRFSPTPRLKRHGHALPCAKPRFMKTSATHTSPHTAAPLAPYSEISRGLTTLRLIPVVVVPRSFSKLSHSDAVGACPRSQEPFLCPLVPMISSISVPQVAVLGRTRTVHSRPLPVPSHATSLALISRLSLSPVFARTHFVGKIFVPAGISSLFSWCASRRSSFPLRQLRLPLH